MIDVANPQSPQIVGSVHTPDDAYGVALSGTLAYVADRDSGLYVIDITDPQSPQIVGNIDTPGSARGVAVSGTLAYVADWHGGLQVIDIADPQNAQIVGTVDTPGYAFGLAVSGALAYVADHDSGLQVIDITTPESPQIVGNVDTPSATGVAVSGTLAYVADTYSRFLVLSAQCDPAGIDENTGIVGTFRLRTVPNPASRQAAIRFELPTAGSVRTTIHDVAGRLVRCLPDGIMSVGVHDVAWDGRDDTGREVAPGIYLARVSTNAGTRTTRVVLLK